MFNSDLHSTDALGMACADYYFNKVETAKIKVESSIVEDDVLQVRHLFRGYSAMPKLEQKALDLSVGKVLDVGAGAGCHSLYLQEKGVDVTANEISPLASKVMESRGVKSILNADFFDLPLTQKYNTILMLMNGIGFVGTLDQLPAFFSKCKSLIEPDGCILLDSSDIKFLFEEEDGSFLVDLNSEYYGQIDYTMKYKSSCLPSFDWLFIDPELLSLYAEQNGFNFELIKQGDHFDYLAKLTLK